MLHHFLFRFVLSGISGSLFPLAFSPLEILPILYLSLGFWLILILIELQKCREHAKLLPFFSIGFSFGLGGFIVGLNGLYVTFSEFGKLSPALSILCLLLFFAYLALFPALVSVCFAKIAHKYMHPIVTSHHLKHNSKHLWFFPFLFANILTLFEWLRGVLLTGFSLTASGYAQVTDGLWSFISVKAWAPYIGWLGLSWWSAFLATVLAMIVWHTYHQWRVFSQRSFLITNNTNLSVRRQVIWRLTTVLTIIGFAYMPHAFSFSWTQPLNQPQAYRLVQSNIPILKKWDTKHYKQNLNILRHLMGDDTQEIVVFSETALTLFTEPLTAEFLQQIEHQSRTLITGGIELETLSNHQNYYNSLMVLNRAPDSKNGSPSKHYYRKHHLVPFGEYPPPGFSWIVKRLSIPMANLSAGKNTENTLRVRQQKVAFSICYENLFIEEMRTRISKADLLINISNTGWYGDSWVMPQHLQVSRMRAIEAQKPMLHVADTGISAFIDTKGKIRQSLPVFQRGTLKVMVDGYQGITPYLHYGDYPILLWSLLGILMVLFHWKR